MLLQTRPVDWLVSRLGIPRGLWADQRIAVCGTHRSGTTLLGEVLAVDPQSRQIFEPFNPAFGIEEATRSFIAGDWPDDRWRQVIDRFMTARSVRFRRPVGDRNSLARWLRGTRQSRDYIAARLVRPSRLVIKCPFMSLASQYMIDRYQFKVVFAVKHPAAFFVALRRVGWDQVLPLDDLVAQGVIDAATRDAATTPAARAGLFWNVVNGHAQETQRRFPGQTAIWSHERFCRDPHAEMSRTADSLDIRYSQPMRLAIDHATQGEVVRPAPDTIHHLVRDAAGLVDDWRRYLSPAEEAELREQCGDLYRTLIGEDW